MNELYSYLRKVYPDFRVSVVSWMKYGYYKGKLEKALKEIGENDPKLMQLYERAKPSMGRGFTKELGNGLVDSEINLEEVAGVYNRLMHDHNLLALFRAIEHRIDWTVEEEEEILEKLLNKE